MPEPLTRTHLREVLHALDEWACYRNAVADIPLLQKRLSPHEKRQRLIAAAQELAVVYAVLRGTEVLEDLAHGIPEDLSVPKVEGRSTS